MSLPQHVVAGTCLCARRSALASESSSTCCSWDMSAGRSVLASESSQHVEAGTCLQGGLHWPVSSSACCSWDISAGRSALASVFFNML